MTIKLGFETEYIDIAEISYDLVCAIFAVPVNKINKKADCRFSRLKAKQGVFAICFRGMLAL